MHLPAHPARCVDVEIVGAEDGANRLLQHQRQPPGGQQRFQRAAVQPADQRALDSDTDQAGDQEGERDRDRQAGAVQRRSRSVDRLLHDKGRIGAEHHHLAMRHVDHAHDAEGDRQPGGSQQQHGTERHPVIDALRDIPQRDDAIDRPHAGLGRGGDGRRLAGQRGKQAARVDIAARANGGNGGESVADRGRCGEQQRGRMRLLHV